MRVDTRKPKQPVTWIPQVLKFFNRKGELSSRELAELLRKTLGGDVLTRCRQLGIPLEPVGVVNGSKPPRKLYALNSHVLWQALEEAIRQIDRYTFILNRVDPSTEYETYRSVAAWMQHIQRLEKLKSKRPGVRNGSLHKTRPASYSAIGPP